MEPTYRSSNTTVAVLGNPADLRINEWLSNPSLGDDWFEIYNPQTLPVDIGGLYLTDDLSDPLQFQIRLLSFV